jgi:hypothetical protein
MQETIARCVIDREESAESLLGHLSRQLDKLQYQQILALRGLLAQGVLLTALMKRNQVEYGVNR